MNFNIDTATKMAKTGALKAFKFAAKHKHVIAVTTAICGYAYAVYDIYENSEEIHGRLEDEKELKRLDDEEPTLNPWEIARTVFPLAWKAFLSFILSTSILILNERGHAKTVTALTTTQQLLLQTIDDLEKSVINEVGENKYKKIKQAAAEDRIEQMLEGRDISKEDIHKTGRGETLMIDLYTGQLLLTDMQYVETVEAQIKALVAEFGCVPSTEYLARMHLNETLCSDYLVFTKDHGVKIDTVSHRRPDGTYITGLVPSLDMSEILRYYKENYSSYDL